MTAEVRKDVIDKQSGAVTARWVRIGDRQNHLFDCESLQTLATLMVKTLPLKERETAPGVGLETVAV